MLPQEEYIFNLHLDKQTRTIHQFPNEIGLHKKTNSFIGCIISTAINGQ